MWKLANERKGFRVFLTLYDISNLVISDFCLIFAVAIENFIITKNNI